MPTPDKLINKTEQDLANVGEDIPQSEPTPPAEPETRIGDDIRQIGAFFTDLYDQMPEAVKGAQTMAGDIGDKVMATGKAVVGGFTQLVADKAKSVGYMAEDLGVKGAQLISNQMSKAADVDELNTINTQFKSSLKGGTVGIHPKNEGLKEVTNDVVNMLTEISGGSYKPSYNIPIVFAPKGSKYDIEPSEKNGTFRGLTFGVISGSKDRPIVINQRVWNKLSRGGQAMLILHELAHADANLSHEEYVELAMKPRGMELMIKKILKSKKEGDGGFKQKKGTEAFHKANLQRYIEKFRTKDDVTNY